MAGPRSRGPAVDAPRAKVPKLAKTSTLVDAQHRAGRTDDADRDIVSLIRRAADAANSGASERDSDDRFRRPHATVALDLLMRRHGTAVYRFCRQQLHDPLLAEDVHQQVFSEAYRDLVTFSGRSTLRTWLFAIARYRVLDAAKARRRARAYLTEEDDEMADTPDPTPQPADQLDDARLIEALVECVGNLDVHTRTVMLLRYQQGFTFDEIAEICKEKAGTLQARVTRALPRLRKCIEARTGGKI
jgi:RNA polymerase sigma-70 factor, ECF subfamily